MNHLHLTKPKNTLHIKIFWCLHISVYCAFSVFSLTDLNRTALSISKPCPRHVSNNMNLHNNFKFCLCLISPIALFQQPSRLTTTSGEGQVQFSSRQWRPKTYLTARAESQLDYNNSSAHYLYNKCIKCNGIIDAIITPPIRQMSVFLSPSFLYLLTY